ncbi:MAG: hypothetical protein ACYCU0_00770 [Solirubrobacteraceae bacterium]
MTPTETRAASRRRLLPSAARSGGVLLAALAAVLCGAAVAVAAASGPTLVKPANKGSVHANRIKLVVMDSSALAKKYGVFVGISRSRKTKSNGFLAATANVKKGESFIKMKPWKGHAGLWIYSPPKYSFPGYWASTAGRYYWQAEHTDCTIKGCEAISRIGSFKVAG